jgi:hypothetical protein
VPCNLQLLGQSGLTEHCCNIPITSLASAPAVLSRLVLIQGISHLQHNVVHAISEFRSTY